MWWRGVTYRKMLILSVAPPAIGSDDVRLRPAGGDTGGEAGGGPGGGVEMFRWAGVGEEGELQEGASPRP